MVRLLGGIGAGVYFDFSGLNFQVPSELSAPKAARVVNAMAISAWLKSFRTCFSFEYPMTAVRIPAAARYRFAGGKAGLLIASDSSSSISFGQGCYHGKDTSG